MGENVMKEQGRNECTIVFFFFSAAVVECALIISALGGAAGAGARAVLDRDGGGDSRVLGPS
eukprot:2335409-Rhodomonas_salina.1